MAESHEPLPLDQRAARRLVRPLVRIGVHPNVVTALTAALALVAAAAFSTGTSSGAAWGAGLFVLSRFLDHFDGELARATGRTSQLGYLLDYAAGGLSYAAVFVGIALGEYRGELGSLALWFGGAAGISAVAAVGVNLELDRLRGDGEAVGYPRWAGFELEDGIYLLAPVTWLGGLTVFFVLACLGAVVYLVWSARCLTRLRRRSHLAG